jgi:DNA topoisomerase-1
MIAMSKVLIVESPAKAKTISKYLNGQYQVVASVGHIRDLPKSNKKAIDIEAGFIPHYEISPGKEKIIAEIKKLVKNADEILLATDPDREGEAIAWHLKEILNLTNAKRVTFNEITAEAVLEAVKNPRQIDEKLKQAQEARRVLDRLVGYDLSGIIWQKVRYGLSAGRVQSPALRILMEREREIRAFIPEDFFVITAQTETSKKEKIQFTCDIEPRQKDEANRIVSVAENGKWQIADIKETEAKRATRPPFITSTLQQVASTRLGFSPSRTMQIAQKLYEAGHITYMRTDSTNLSTSAIGSIASVVKKEFGPQHLASKNFKAGSKNAQEAHEAIRPSNPAKKSVGHTTEQKKLYELIWARAVASQMTDAKILRTKITAKVESKNSSDKPIPNFSVNGSQIIYPGWLLADPASRGEDIELPDISVGDILNLIKIILEAKQTTPPQRYTEAGLIKELEKRGIGRPSTYASIMKTLADRGYVEKQGRTLLPTDTGDVVSTFLEQNFSKYISDSFTAEMENELDEIAEGKRTYRKTLSDFYGPFTAEINEKKKLDKATSFGKADDKFKCPKCNAGMEIKLGRGGKFLSCINFPDCSGALTIDGVEIKADEPIGTHPESGENIFVKVGRFGPYVQMGESLNAKQAKEKGLGTKAIKAHMASIPKEKDIATVTIEDAVKYLSLPRLLGNHPETGKEILANNGRFGPYVVLDGDFRSIKSPDNVYDITLERALEILAEPKKKRGFKKKRK